MTVDQVANKAMQLGIGLLIAYIRTLHPALYHFCEQGIKSNKTYQSALHRFAQFCSMYSILTPFPVSESLLCYFETHLACQQLSPQTVKV